MTQRLIKLVGGPNNGSRITAPPPEMRSEGRVLRLRNGDRYELCFNDSIGSLPGWEAHYLEDNA